MKSDRKLVEENKALKKRLKVLEDIVIEEEQQISELILLKDSNYERNIQIENLEHDKDQIISEYELKIKALKNEVERLKGFEDIQQKIWDMFGTFSELKALYEQTRGNNA